MAIDVLERERLLDEAVLEYLDAKAAGRIDVEALLTRHPAVAAELADFLAAEGAVGAALAPPSTLRPAATADGTATELPNDDAPPAFGKYTEFDLISRGGMGAVYRCRDGQLGRSLALKVMHAHLAREPEFVNDFREEARVASQLTHPNIAPVHELGALPDGRPYFTMKLVEGRTLAEAIKAYRDAPSAEGFNKLLRAFAEVCHALAYAHQRGVLHRDLKPANVMVGAFGEVQVMDWGLSKVVAGGAVSVHAAGADAATTAGLVRGTFAYMPPEQADPDRPPLDARADVFALGAVLCEILTGAPPYVPTAADRGARQRELWEMARHARTAEAFRRLDGCGAPARLVALAKSCLSARSAGRPAGARDVGAGVEAYFAEVQEDARRVEVGRARRRWRIASGAVALLLVIALTAAGIWYRFDREAKRQEGERRADEARLQELSRAADVTGALTEMYAALESDRFNPAAAALERAHGSLGPDAPVELRAKVAEAERHFAAARSVDRIRQEPLAIFLGQKDYVPASPKQYAALFASLGIDPMGPDAGPTIARSPIRHTLLDALDDWATHEPDPEKKGRLMRVARAADPDPDWGDRFRDPAVRGDATKLADLARQAPAAKLSLTHIVQLVYGLIDDDAAVLPLLRAAGDRFPDDYWVHVVTGVKHERLARTTPWHRQEALSHLRAAASLRPDAQLPVAALAMLYSREDGPDSAAQMGRCLDRLNPDNWLHDYLHFAAAVKRRQPAEAERWLERVYQREPSVGLFYDLAVVYLQIGDFPKMLATVERGLKAHPANTRVLALKSIALGSLNRRDEAEAIYRALTERAPEAQETNLALLFVLVRRGRALEVERVLGALGAADPEIAESLDPIRGIFALMRGDAERAVEIFELLHAHLGVTPQISIFHSMALARVGRFERARQINTDLSAWLDKNPVDLDALLGAGPGLTRSLLSVVGISSARIALWNHRIHLKNFMDMDARVKGGYPTFDWERLPKIGVLGVPFGDYFLARKHYSFAARVYEVSSTPSSFASGRSFSYLQSSTNRISAARAAAQAWLGGGIDAIQFKDADRDRFRNLALRWLKEEWEDCERLAKGSEAEQRLANARLLELRLHRELDPVRNPVMLKQMPEDDRKLAEDLWAGVEALDAKLNPPLDWVKLPGL
jgi:tetratricopeptide (TPR) repeat protein